jgi:hypothetical protein
MSKYCNQTLAGITLDCTNNKGGIKTVYIANFGDVTGFEENEGVITGITMNGEAKFKPYQFRKNTSSMNSTLTADETNGLNYVTTEVSLVFTKMDTAKRVEMAALSLGQLAVIVLDSNGIYWYITPDDYASASAGTGETGTAKGDRNAYTLTLSVENDSYPIEIAESALAEIVAE